MQQSASHPPSASLILEVHAMLGQCLLVYQAVELVLKLTLPHVFKTEAAALASQDVDWRDLLDRPNTLGQLVQELGRRTEVRDRPAFEAAMKTLVSQRNEVVHHFLDLPFSQLASEHEARQALSYLQDRHGSALRHLDVFKSFAGGVLGDTSGIYQH